MPGQILERRRRAGARGKEVRLAARRAGAAGRSEPELDARRAGRLGTVASRSGQALDAVAEGERAPRRRAGLGRRTVLVHDAGEPGRHRALAALAAAADRLVVHRPGAAGSEVRPGVGEIERPGGVRRRVEAREALREADLHEVGRERLPVQGVHAFVRRARGLEVHRARRRQVLVVDQRLGNDVTRVHGVEAGELLPLAVDRGLHHPALYRADAEAGVATRAVAGRVARVVVAGARLGRHGGRELECVVHYEPADVHPDVREWRRVVPPPGDARAGIAGGPHVGDAPGHAYDA